MTIELDGPRLPPRAGGAARQLVVFLHGYGANGNDLIDIGRDWQALLPHAAFVSPHAPEPCAAGAEGRQWFPLDHSRHGRTLARREHGPGRRSTLPRRRIAATQSRHRTGCALVGFSQGTMMALHVGLRRAVRRRHRRLFRRPRDA